MIINNIDKIDLVEKDYYGLFSVFIGTAVGPNYVKLLNGEVLKPTAIVHMEVWSFSREKWKKKALKHWVKETKKLANLYKVPYKDVDWNSQQIEIEVW